MLFAHRRADADAKRAKKKLAGLLAGVAAWSTGGRAALAARDDAGSRLLLGHMRD